MIAKVLSATCIGITGHRVIVEVDGSRGLPAITIVGLPDQAVKESRERIRAALIESGFRIPGKRFTVNLAPADLKKEGPGFDVPIALGILADSGYLNKKLLKRYAFAGELSLDGIIRPVQGVLSMALSFRKQKCIFVVPEKNVREARVQQRVPIASARTLSGLVTALNNEALVPQPHDESDITIREDAYDITFDDVRGHYGAKRALEVAVSGGHNIMMVGPPGSGKTMLARALPSLLPQPLPEELLDIIRIYSTRMNIARIRLNRPFRSPHHTISAPAMAGSGSHPKPGEVSLAHNGVLFLDEFPEFPRSVIETLRGPLEDRCVTIARAKDTITYPANFMLVCAMNPCPCGYLGDKDNQCTCKYDTVIKYRAKISGPISDRIDIHIEVPRIAHHELKEKPAEKTADMVRTRIEQVRALQRVRYEEHGFFTNTELPPKLIHEYCALTRDAEALLDKALVELHLSPRSYHRILKLGRTIADMELCADSGASVGVVPPITAEQISEAIQYRSLDRQV